MRQRVYAGFISGQTAQKSPLLCTQCQTRQRDWASQEASRGAFSPSREAQSISNRRERQLAPSGRARLPCGGRASPTAFAPPGICGNAPPSRRKRPRPSTCVVFNGIISFFVCAAFEKRLQIVNQKDGPCGTAFALGAMRPATSRPFCTSLQSRRACPQSAALRAARAV